MTAEEDKCDCGFYRCMKLPCRHIFKLLSASGQDLYVPTQYHSKLNVTYRQCTVTASVGTPLKQRTVLTKKTEVQESKCETTKVSKCHAMDSFMQKMAFIDELLSLCEGNESRGSYCR